MNITSIMKELDLNCYEMAEILDVSTKTIERLRTGIKSKKATAVTRQLATIQIVLQDDKIARHIRSIALDPKHNFYRGALLRRIISIAGMLLTCGALRPHIEAEIIGLLQSKSR